MMEVSLQEILSARENRVWEQQRLLEAYGVPLISFTMNIPGPVKDSPLIRRGFQAGLAQLEKTIPWERILFRHTSEQPTGCTAFYAVSMEAARLKLLCTDIEETHPLGRLFDMDVLDTDGRKPERKTERGCMVCGAPGRGCAARRLHPVETLQAVTRQMLENYFAREDCLFVAEKAVQSLLDEVRTTPKPGLVDRRNNGSHADMDLPLFEISARKLQPYFQRCVQIGQDTAHRPSEETFPLLRAAGMEAEKGMLAATGGVNTHKGAIYTLGILCGCVGRLWSAEKPVADSDSLFAECANLVRASVPADLAAATGKTAGERLYLRHGIRGIRGEIADGMPSVKKLGLPCFRQYLADGYSENDAGAYTLLHLIGNVADTNLHKRGGMEGAQWAARAAKALLPAAPPPAIRLIEALDDEFIARDLSPGGCADLLAATYFLHKLTLLP